MRGIDIIWFSLDRVENKYSSTSFSMAKELSKECRVFFVNNPFTLSEYFKDKIVKRNVARSAIVVEKRSGRYGKIDGLSENFISVTPAVTLPINWLKKGRLYSWASYFNNRLFLKSLKKLIVERRIEKFIFVNVFNPFYGRLFIDSLQPILKIYYSVDDIRFSPYVKKHGPFLEREIVTANFITLTTSRHLRSLLSAYSSKVHCLPNAADTSLFRTAYKGSFPKPAELTKIETPIIMYTGHLDWRVDQELLTDIATHHHDKTVVIVGPVSLKPEDMSRLQRFNNIRFTGSKPLEELPAYLHFAHCAIIPFKCNVLTKSIYPLKINEYLSAGLPVVATGFSEDILQFEDVISVANDASQFCVKISDEITMNSDLRAEERIRVAGANTWASRVDQFWKIVESEILKVD